MSRIGGIWNLSGTPVKPDVARTMMGAVAVSLPALHGEAFVLVQEEVAMGYRPTLVGPPGQSGVFAPGDWPLMVVADARLDNRDQLSATLGLEAHAPARHLTDAELIARAYQRWELDSAAHLLGAFAFVLWDPVARRLLCARDHLGARPLYYQRTAQRFAFASEVKQILALSDGPVAFNETLIGLHLAGADRPHAATYFAGIAQLPPAHLLVVTPDGDRRQRYWDIDPQRRIRYQSDAEYGEHFREIFVEAVRCRLRPYESTGVLLSGGLDSSAVASVAAWLHEQGEDVPWPLHTFSWLYDELSSADEREYSAAVNATYGLTPHGVAADDRWPLQDDPEGATDPDEPFSRYFRPLVKDMLQVVRDEGIDVLLTGHPGDNLVGGNVFPYPDLFRRGQWLRLARELWQHSQHSRLNAFGLFWQACVKPVAPPWLKRWRRRLSASERTAIPGWIAPEFAAYLDLEQRIAEAEAWGHPGSLDFSKSARYRMIFHPNVARTNVAHDRLAARLGLTYRHPWLDKRLAEFVMAIPTDQTIRDGLRKVVLRNALRGILPEKVRARRLKAYPTPLIHRGLRERARSRVENLLTNTRLAEYGWVSEGPMRDHYARYVAGDLDTEWPLWQAITLELWLREHF